MRRDKFEKLIYENVEVLDAGSEGKCVARVNDMVIFIPFVVPGDIIDVQVVKKKKSFIEGKAIKFHHLSDKRAEVLCSHFGLCGGCKWQGMKYEEQLHFKHKQVYNALTRIGKLENPTLLPILGSEKTTNYRNKLEYTFSNHKWFVEKSDIPSTPESANALGFHLPMLFDRVLDIDWCYLQEEPSNAIRLEAKKYAFEHDLTFYDVRNWTGLLRNIIIRNSNMGDLLVIFVFNYQDEEVIFPMLDHFKLKFPEITSLYYVINSKKNDVISDLSCELFHGKPHMTERMIGFATDKELHYKIGPISFFQTNSTQAANLYRIAAEFAEFKGDEVVYDLYTGTGTIANYIAGAVQRVVGIESVAAAIEDAKENSLLNEITNTSFHTGEVEKLLTPEFIQGNGVPDTIITDPPRSGMHEKVIQAMLQMGPKRIVYISCNPATQARDILLLSNDYQFIKCQPVDMFPHTQHMESVVLLEKRSL